MRRNRVFAAMLAILMVVSLTACGQESVGTPGGELENGVAAIEDAMTTKPNDARCVLCGLAQGLGGIPNGKGHLGRCGKH